MRIATKAPISVASNSDHVEVTIDGRLIRIPYEVAFTICGALRVACKNAMARGGEPHPNWRAFEDAGKEAWHNRLPRSYRNQIPQASNLKPNVKKWDVGREGVDGVVLGFDDFRFTAHFADMLTLAGWVRSAAREAKRWRGHDGATMRVSGWLTSAEENNRLGIQ